MIKTQLLSNFFWQFSADALSFSFAFLFYSILGQSLGETGLGSYNYVLSFLLIVFVFVDIGITPFLLRRWSISPETATEDNKVVLGIKLSTLLGTTSLLLPYILLFERQLLQLFSLAWIYLALEIPISNTQSFLRATNQFRISSSISLLDKFFFHVVGIAIILSGGGLSLVFLSGIVGRICSIFIFQRHLNALSRPDFRWSHFRSFLSQALPFFLVSAFSNLYFKIDLIVIRRLLDLSEVGFYSAAYRVIEASLLFPTLISLIFLPTVSKLFSQKDYQKLQIILEKTTLLLYSISLFLTSFFIVYRYEIIDFIYGNNFITSSKILSVLSLSLPLFFLNAILVTFLIAKHKEKLLAKFYLLATVANLILNLLLIPSIGSTGAAVATVLCEIFIFFSLIFTLRSRLPLAKMIITTCIGTLLTLTLNWFHPLLFTGMSVFGVIFLLTLFFLDLLPVDILFQYLPSKYSRTGLLSLLLKRKK